MQIIHYGLFWLLSQNGSSKNDTELSKSYQTMKYWITGELYSVTIYMNYLNRFLCETNLAKITIFYLYKFPIMAQKIQINL